jgi:hypothetical protein
MQPSSHKLRGETQLEVLWTFINLQHRRTFTVLHIHNPTTTDAQCCSCRRAVSKPISIVTRVDCYYAILVLIQEHVWVDVSSGMKTLRANRWRSGRCFCTHKRIQVKNGRGWNQQLPLLTITQHNLARILYLLQVTHFLWPPFELWNLKCIPYKQIRDSYQMLSWTQRKKVFEIVNRLTKYFKKELFARH